MPLWKVLIVEDEVFVRESIRETIRWEEYGFTVIGEAGDGVDALEQIRSCQPDLVLCDILMPEMDGIELLRHVRAEGMDCRFVMLTCSGEFEYVRQAMEYGASNYILKLSMSVQVLKETLHKISIELYERAKARLPRLDAEYQAAWDWMYGEDQTDTEEVAIPAAYQSLHVSIAAVLHGDAPFDKQDAEQLFGSCRGVLVVHSWRKYGQTSFFCWSKASCSPQLDEWQQLPYPVGTVGSLRSDQLWSGWRACLRQLDAAWYGLDRSEKLNQSAALPFSQTWKLERELINLLEQGDIGNCRKLADNAWHAMRQEHTPMGTVQQIAARWLRLSSQITNQSYEGEGLACCTTHDALLQRLLNRLESNLQAWNAQRYALTNHPEINKIIQYIHTNYDQNITVKRMADHVLLAESYVSGLFKKKMGMNLIGYLHRVRIEKAKELLELSEFPVAEIGQKVGFANDNYFNKIFKRLTKLTPSDYRRTFKR